MYKCFSCLAANRAYLTYCMVGVWCLLVAAFALPFALLLISLFYCAYEHSDNSYSLGWTGCDSRLNSSQRDCALQVSPHERMYNPKHWWPRGSLHHSRYTLQYLWIRPCENTSKHLWIRTQRSRHVRSNLWRDWGSLKRPHYSRYTSKWLWISHCHRLYAPEEATSC